MATPAANVAEIERLRELFFICQQDFVLSPESWELGRSWTTHIYGSCGGRDWRVGNDGFRYQRAQLRCLDRRRGKKAHIELPEGHRRKKPTFGHHFCPAVLYSVFKTDLAGNLIQVTISLKGANHATANLHNHSIDWTDSRGRSDGLNAVAKDLLRETNGDIYNVVDILKRDYGNVGAKHIEQHHVRYILRSVVLPRANPTFLQHQTIEGSSFVSIIMPSVLVVGATRGLGYEISKYYHGLGYNVTGTARSSTPEGAPQNISWISGVDVSEEMAGKKIVEGLKGYQQDVVILTAGFFGKESFDEPDYEAEVKMYKTSAIAPVFIVHALSKAGLLKTAEPGHTGTKIIIVSSESGSINLRHESEGGGMFAHHASKAASNMVGKLLSLDLKDQNIAVGIVHPGFMRTEMTRNVGFDQFWDAGGAVAPDVAAKSLGDWVETEFDIRKTGEYWAPRGPGDIGTAEHVLGQKDKLPTPLQLPW